MSNLDPIIFDVSQIGALFKAAGDGNTGILDDLLGATREFVFTPAMEAELDPNNSNAQAFMTWVNSHSSQRLGSDVVVDAQDYQTYAPHLEKVQTAINNGQPLSDSEVGDVSVAKFLDQVQNDGKSYLILSSDNDLVYYPGPGNHVSYAALPGLLNGELKNGSLSAAKYNSYAGNLDSGYINSIQPEFRNLLMSPEEVAEFNATKLNSILGDYAGTVKLGTAVSAGVMSAALEVARQAGLIGDIVSFVATANQAIEFRENGETSKANEIWVKYLFEFGGGVAGGAFGLFGTAVVTKGAGGFLAPIAGALAGGVAGSLGGAALGEYLYAQFPDAFDPVFDDIYAFADSLVATGKSLPEALSEAFIQGLGFDLTSVEGGSTGDVLWATDYGQRDGNGGDDLLVGWNPTFVEAGSPVDPGNPESEPATGDLQLILEGDAGNDIIFLRGGERAIADGGDGEDLLIASGGQQHQLFGGAGDDTFLAINSPATVFTTGDGADTVWWSSNVGVTDLSTEDRVKLLGVISLHGGSRSVTSESAWATGLGGVVRYGLNDDGELVINLPWMPEGQQDMFLLNWEDSKIDDFTGGGNITVFEAETWVGRLLDNNKPSGLSQQGFWEAFGLTLKTFTGENAYGGGDPLVLDLDGDGIELTTKSSISPQFDIDYDLYAERTAFVDPDDGALARDINGDGVINDASELFGYGTTSGFSVLSTLDGNSDGQVDASDNGLADFNGDGVVDANDTFSSLLVWQDTDRDAVSDAGELTSLDALGITSLSLTTTIPASEDASGGNRITEIGSFTRNDATQGDVANVILRTTNQASEYIGAPITVTTAAEALPDLRNSGTVVTLREAMSNHAQSLTDVTNALVNFTSPDMETLRDAVRPILKAWAEGSPVRLADGTIATGSAGLSNYDDLVIVRDANGDIVDYGLAGTVLQDPSYTTSVLKGEDIAVHERLIGESLAAFYETPTNDGAANSGMTTFIENIERDLDLFAVRIAVQGGPISSHFSSVAYSANTDKFTVAPGGELSDAFASLMTAADLESNPVDWLASWEPFLDVLIGDFSRGGTHLRNSYAFLAQNIIAAHEQVSPSFSLLDAATALDIPQEIFALGTGTVNGTGDADIFYLNGGDQTLVGGGGIDNYIVGQTFGNDVIDDTEVYGQDSRGSDYLRFSAHNAADITATRSGIDLILTVTATGETITVKNQFGGEWPAPIVGDTSDNTGVNEIIFADGEVWTKLDIAYAVNDPDVASTAVTGTSETDVLEGGAGDDTLSGGGEGDIYVFGIGDGADEINDNENSEFRNGFDVLQFTDGITQDDLTFTRNGASNNITIGIAGTTDSVTINDQFEATETGSFGTWWEDRIEIFTFDDGSGLNYDDIMDLTLQTYSTAGDDFVYGFDRDDRLDGGAGNDYLSGGDYSDTYVFGRGYGQDTIRDNLNNVLTDDFDRMVFNTDISPEDIVFLPSVGGHTNDLTIQISGTTDSLTIVNQFDLTPFGFGFAAFDRIEEAVFTDGSDVVWTWQDMRGQALAAAKTAGDDSMFGYTVSDTLDGGAGNDTLSGYGSSDTYIVGRGSGNDTIRENNQNILLTDEDVIDFGDVLFSEVSVSRNGNNLSITINDTGETVTIEKQYARYTAGGRSELVENFKFADQTVSYQDLDPEDIVLTGTLGDDTLVGTAFNDTFDAKEGNDRLVGKDDADTYWFGAGYGNDVINDTRGSVLWDGDDIVKFTAEVTTANISLSRNGLNLVVTIGGYTDQLTIENQFGNDFTVTGIEQFHFSDGTIWTSNDMLSQMVTSGNDDVLGFSISDTIDGGLGDDTIDGNLGSDDITGGAGNDSLIGAYGSDTYHYNLGDGADIIFEGYNQGPNDRLELGAGILVSEVTVTRSSVDTDDFTLSFIDGGSILLDGQFTGVDQHGVENIVFADGTVWAHADLANMHFASVSTAGNDDITGFMHADVIDAGAGNDTVFGVNGQDTITGGLGDDFLEGDYGSDTYIYNLGDGNDTILEGYNRGSADRLELGAGILASEVTVTGSAQDSADVVLTFSDGATVVLDEQFRSLYQHGVEEIVFADGTVWDHQILADFVLGAASTDGDDVLNGTMGGDFLSGGLGNDTIYASNGVDTIIGGLGDDYLEGGYGSDVYFYDLGDGADTIYEMVNQGGGDRIEFGAGILASEITFTRTGADTDDITLHFVDGGSIFLNEQFNYSAQIGVEQFVFADGTVWTDQDLANAYFAAASTSGNDTIYGTVDYGDVIDGGAGDDLIDSSNGVDTITGGAGDDTLKGGANSDRYLFGANDGADLIDEWGSSSNTDRVIFDASVMPTDISLIRAPGNSNDAIVTNVNTGATIYIDDQFRGTSYGIEEIVFDDGTVWDRAYISVNSPSHVGTTGDDTINGSSGGDVIRGLAGDDLLKGGQGSDTYLFAADDGADIIDEYGSVSNTDRIRFDIGISPTDILLSVAADNSNDLIATNVNTGATIRVDDHFYPTHPKQRGVEEIVFADGTVWNRSDIDTLSNTAPPVVLDLDGDGVELISLDQSRTRFDFDGDGVRERGGWIGRDDGVLALDRNGDGRIAGIAEISFLSDLEGARSDLEGLGGFDTNGDGVFSAADERFSDFVVWQDRNSNGRSERSELSTLSELGIISIDPVGVAPVDAAPVSLDDNTILGTASVSWADGSETDLADVALRYEERSVSGKRFEFNTGRDDFLDLWADENGGGGVFKWRSDAFSEKFDFGNFFSRSGGLAQVDADLAFSVQSGLAYRKLLDVEFNAGEPLFGSLESGLMSSHALGVQFDREDLSVFA